MSEKSDTFKLGMELTYFDVVALIDDLREENANLTARIAELEKENLELRKTPGWAYDLDEYKDKPEVTE